MAKKVLVAEDDAVLAAIVHTTLEAVGYDVVAVVGTGEEALQRCLSQEPDIVVLDVSLAGSLNGIEVAERLRRRSACPVVFHTAHSDHAHLIRMELVRNSAVVRKPADIDRLLEAMACLVNAVD